MMRTRHALRLLLAAVAVTAIAGATTASAAVAPAAVNQSAAVSDGWTAVPGSGYATNSSACMVELWTSQVSAGDPAYIAVNAFQLAAPYTCEAMVQISSDGGQTWTSQTPVSLPAVTGFSLPVFSANTGAVYDGPGYLGRACAEASNSTLVCTASVSLSAGTGTPPDPALPAGTLTGSATAGNGSVECNAVLSSTTIAKGSGTLVDGAFRGGYENGTSSSLCEGWLETSMNDGATWQATLPVIFQAPAGSVTNDVIGTIPDGTGILARACAEAPTISATPYCSPTW
jgi:hypothetical protein